MYIYFVKFGVGYFKHNKLIIFFSFPVFVIGLLKYLN